MEEKTVEGIVRQDLTPIFHRNQVVFALAIAFFAGILILLRVIIFF